MTVPHYWGIRLCHCRGSREQSRVVKGSLGVVLGPAGWLYMLCAVVYLRLGLFGV